MNTILKTALLASTILTTGTILSQRESNKNLNNSNNKFKASIGFLNTRGLDQFDNLIEHGFIKPTYAITDRMSVSAEVGTSYLSIQDKRVYNLSPAFHYTGEKFQASLGFFDVNNQPYAKATYQPKKGTSFSVHAQSLTQPLGETNFLPKLPNELKLSTLTLIEQKMLIHKGNAFGLGATVGLGVSTSAQKNTRLAYKAMFAVNYKDFSLVAGVQPLAPADFSPKAAMLLKYSF